MNGIVLYIKDSYNELVHNVTWPTWSSLISNSRLVLVASIIIALIIFVMDMASNGVTSTLYTMFTDSSSN